MNKSHSSATLRIVGDSTSLHIATNRLGRTLDRLEAGLQRSSSKFPVANVVVSTPPEGQMKPILPNILIRRG